MRKSEIADLEGDVGYFTRMLVDEWFQEYDEYFDVDDVNEHLENLDRAIDDVEHGSQRTTKQALARAREVIAAANAGLALHTALSTGASKSVISSAAVRVAKTWSCESDTPIPIFTYANTLLATPVPWTA